MYMKADINHYRDISNKAFSQNILQPKLKLTSRFCSHAFWPYVCSMEMSRCFMMHMVCEQTVDGNRPWLNTRYTIISATCTVQTTL